MITPELIKFINPGIKDPDVVASKFQSACEQFGITTPVRLAHFLGQLWHESNLEPKEENLNYSARRLTQVWPNRFPDLSAAKPFANNPEALGNKTYGGRMGNTEPGDGFKFRGRGYIQLTGKANYEKFGKLVKFDLVKDPDLLLQIGVGALVAGAFWQQAGCNSVASNLKLTEEEKCRAITQRINGGTNGLQDRWRKTQKVMKFLSGK